MTSPPAGFVRGTATGWVSAVAVPTSGPATLDILLTVGDVYVMRTVPWLTPAQRGETLHSYPGFSSAWWIDWGDGNSQVVGLGSGPDQSMQVPHTYQSPGTYQINVESGQVNGGAASGQGGVFPIITVTSNASLTIPIRASARSAQTRFKPVR